MKPYLLALSLVPLASSLPAAPVMRDAATHDQLANTLRKVQANDPMKKFTPAEGKDPSKENQIPDLLSRSDMLCFNGMATLVPKGSILVTPPLISDRVGMRPDVKIVPWLEFYAANRGWIAIQEINLKQAEGNEPLSQAVVEKLLKSTTVVVATLHGGPISKLAPKEVPQPEEAGAAAK